MHIISYIYVFTPRVVYLLGSPAPEPGRPGPGPRLAPAPYTTTLALRVRAPDGAAGVLRVNPKP